MESFKGGKWVWRNGVKIDITHGDPEKPRKSDVQIGGIIAPVVNPLDGKEYTDIAKYERVVKEKGGVIVGNEKIENRVDKTPKNVKKDILRAWELLEQRPKEVPPERHEEWVRDIIKERG